MVYHGFDGQHTILVQVNARPMERATPHPLCAIGKVSLLNYERARRCAEGVVTVKILGACQPKGCQVYHFLRLKMHMTLWL